MIEFCNLRMFWRKRFPCVCVRVWMYVCLHTSGICAGKTKQRILQNYLCTTTRSNILCRCCESRRGLHFYTVWKRFLFFSEKRLFFLSLPLEPNAVVAPGPKTPLTKWNFGVPGADGRSSAPGVEQGFQVQAQQLHQPWGECVSQYSLQSQQIRKLWHS